MPVYNAAEYLEKSLLVLNQQTLEDIEIILVNDASEDKSLDIITAFKIAFEDKFVAINCEKNGGPGKARNAGLRYARGEYIGFVDCDDFAHRSMYELLYNKAKEKNSDVVMCAYHDERSNRDNFIDTYRFKNGLDKESRNYLMAFTGFLWHSIFKRSVIDRMSMYFNGEYDCEDMDFLAEFYCHAESIDFVDKALYVYSYNREGLSSTIRPLADCVSLVKRNAASIRRRCENTLYYNDVKEGLEYIYLKLACIWMYAMVTDEKYTPENIKMFQSYLQEYAPDYENNQFFIKNLKKDPITVLFSKDTSKFKENLKKFFEKL